MFSILCRISNDLCEWEILRYTIYASLCVTLSENADEWRQLYQMVTLKLLADVVPYRVLIIDSVESKVVIVNFQKSINRGFVVTDHKLWKLEKVSFIVVDMQMVWL